MFFQWYLGYVLTINRDKLVEGFIADQICDFVSGMILDEA